jgi:hypothetical protein
VVPAQGASEAMLQPSAGNHGGGGLSDAVLTCSNHLRPRRTALARVSHSVNEASRLRGLATLAVPPHSDAFASHVSRDFKGA